MLFRSVIDLTKVLLLTDESLWPTREMNHPYWALPFDYPLIRHELTEHQKNEKSDAWSLVVGQIILNNTYVKPVSE
mgnify:FL=1